MNLRIILLFFLILGIVAFLLFTSTFSMFEEPKVLEYKSSCDYDGSRAIRTELISGNAATNRSIRIGLVECGDSYNDLKEYETFFIADNGNPHLQDVNVQWMDFCTVRIHITKNLRIFKNDTLITDGSNCDSHIRVYYEKAF